MSEYKHEQVRSRNEPFAQRTATRIWHEQPSADNPYIATSALCQGYDLFELMDKRSFVDVFYLLFRGELPSKTEAQLLQTLMVALINPGPRHPATRAAMNVGVGKTDPVHILPIATSVLGGQHAGSGEVEQAMMLFEEYKTTDARDSVARLLNDIDAAESAQNNPTTLAGFGRHYGGIDVMAQTIAQRFLNLDGAGSSLIWGNELAKLLEPHGAGWLTTGVAAAVLSDLGFQPRAGACLFQLLGAPGLLAHGLELASKPILAMPFVSDENYVIER